MIMNVKIMQQEMKLHTVHFQDVQSAFRQTSPRWTSAEPRVVPRPHRAVYESSFWTSKEGYETSHNRFQDDRESVTS